MAKRLNSAIAMEFEKQEDCDVQFSVDGQTIGAHKFMLKIQSEVLYEMASGWSFDNEPLSIENMEFNSFKTLLRYIYSEEIAILNNNVLIFLAASVHYKMPHLEELCASHIAECMGPQNVCSYMNQAIDFGSVALQKRCCEIFSKQTYHVASNKSFKDLSQPALSALLDTEETTELEIFIFRCVKIWMTQKCLDQHLIANGTNMRQVIGDALYKIRFPTMTVQDFANCVTTVKGLLTDNEKAQVFEMITVFEKQDVTCVFPDKFRCRGNRCYTPYDEITKLCDGSILYNCYDHMYCDLRSMLKYMEDLPDDQKVDLTSFRLVLQCCADLANSCGWSAISSASNQAKRHKLANEFCTWRETVNTKDNGDIMTKFLNLRTTLNEFCVWK